MASQQKEIYELSSEHQAFYTGGEVAWTTDGSQLLCQCEDAVQSVDVTSGRISLALTRTPDDAEEDLVYTFRLSHDDTHVLTAHRSGLMKLWSKSDGTRIKMWKSGHKGPVARLAFDFTNECVASGGSDGIVRLWDLSRQTCTGSLRGAAGVFSILEFHPTKELAFGAADDAKIRSWNSKTGKEHQVYSGHFSKVTALQFTCDGQHAVSSGRDRVLILWDIEEGRAVRTLPVYESIESLVVLPPKFRVPNDFKKSEETEGIFVACGGEKGVVKVWNVAASRLVFEQSNSLVSAAAEEGGLAIVRLLFNEARKCLAVVTADHNIIIHELKTFGLVKQMVGFTDEVLDVIFVGAEDAHVVVATNSTDLKHYNLDTMNCEIVKGHTDIVLALARFPTHPDMFVSSGKDNSVRLWLKDADNGIKCVGAGSRHTASVGSVFTAQSSNSFFASVGQDNCLKVWSTPKQFDEENKLNSTHTQLAHQADINCVVVSPSDKMIATGSQDKTAKLWSAELALLGVLRGHRRGVWCVRFSPVDQVLLSCSADCSIKLWSIDELSCLKTLEGHESSVLKVEFLGRGSQIMSSGADGLLKLWTIKTSECRMSLDGHDGKVWALAVSSDEATVVTGGSDSKLVRWRDATAERRERLATEREESALQEQELSNLLHDKKLVKALKLALRLDRPLHVLRIINEIIKEDDSKLRETIKEINNTQKEALLKCAAEWNTNTRNCHAAQVVLHVLSRELVSGELRVAGLPALLEAMLPYSERHYERLTGLLQDLSFITYTVNSMQPHSILRD